jgi:hypothetical protein
LLRLLREHLDLPLPEVAYEDLNSVGGREGLGARYLRSRQLLTTAALSAEDAGTLFDHPLLRFQVGGLSAYLEPDLIAFRLRDRFHVVEIKSFPVIDRRADPQKVAAAATQSAVYVLAMRQLLEELGFSTELVSHEVFWCVRRTSPTGRPLLWSMSASSSRWCSGKLLGLLISERLSPHCPPG